MTHDSLVVASAVTGTPAGARDRSGSGGRAGPMLELLAYLRASGFKTFIVSGGGADFMRVFAEQVYGIPPEQVVGSTGETKFEVRDGKAVLLKLSKVNHVDDKAG